MWPGSILGILKPVGESQIVPRSGHSSNFHRLLCFLSTKKQSRIFDLEFGNLHLPSHLLSFVGDSFDTFFFFKPPFSCQESEELEELDEARIFPTRGHHKFSPKTVFWMLCFFFSKLTLA